MHVLDNAAWHALETFHAAHAQRLGVARRYDPEVSVFAAIEHFDAEGWQAVADLVAAHGPVVLFRAEAPDPPAGLQVAWGGVALQMVLDDPAPLHRIREAAADHATTRVEGPDGAPAVVALGSDDAEEMVALVARTEPGPFRPRTVELGDYIGVRHEGRLVAMAGTRLRLPGYTEISAVCTDEDMRGRGLASLVTALVAERIEATGSVPVLHVAEHNAPAIRLYEQLGFRHRRTVVYRSLVSAAG